MRTPHNPDPIWRLIVRTLAEYGVTQPEIAQAVGISETTLRKYYREELNTGYVVANTRVAANLFRIAISDEPGSVTAAIFWCKARMGWRV